MTTLRATSMGDEQLAEAILSEHRDGEDEHLNASLHAWVIARLTDENKHICKMARLGWAPLLISRQLCLPHDRVSDVVENSGITVAITKRVPGQRDSYRPARKAAVRDELLANNRNFSKTARETGVPLTTVRRWGKDWGIAPYSGKSPSGHAIPDGLVAAAPHASERSVGAEGRAPTDDRCHHPASALSA